MSNTNYPFSAPDGASPPQSFPFDVVIQEAFPGLVKLGTEPNSVYTAFREVSGADWWVINADWDANQGFWTQNDSCNANLPAYAMAQDRNGTVVRYRTDATTLPNTQITWTPVWQIKDKGNLIRTPTAYQSAVTDMNNLLVWNMGTSTRAIARSTSITDTSSASNSMLEQNFVNNAEVWSIDKTGTLTAGIVPYARVTGAPAPFDPNNATFTGTTTFEGPAILEDGLTVTGGTSTFDGPVVATAGITANNVTVTGTFTPPGGGAIGDIPAYTTASFVLPATGSSVTVAISSSHGFPIGAVLQVYGPGVNFRATVTANNGTPQTSITLDVGTIISGTAGNTVATGAVCTPGSQVKVTSSDSSITIANAGSPADPIVNLTVTPVTPPAYPQGSCYVSSSGGPAFTVTVPGTSGQVWAAFLIGSAQSSSLITSGYLQVEGTGTTVGSSGTGWNAGVTQISNPDQYIVPLSLAGIVRGGDSLTATFSASGGALVASQATVIMNRLS